MEQTAQQSNAAAANPVVSSNPPNDYEERYRKLKKKYALLLQEHQKVLNEFEKSNEEIRGLNSEKAFLKNKINDILSRNGFNVQSFEQEEQQIKEGASYGNEQSSKLDDLSKQDDSAMQQE